MSEQKYAPGDEPPPYPVGQPQSYPMQQQPPQQPYPPQQPTGYPPQPAGYPPQPTTVTTSNVVVTGGQPAPTTVVIERSASRDLTGCDIAGLILAILGFFCCFPIGLIAVILSSIALVQRCDGKPDSADALSKASVITSIVGFVILVIVVVIIIVYTVVLVDQVASTIDDYDTDGYK